MAQLIVRGLEDDVKARLQKRAKRHGRSMEAEARDILREVLREDELPHGGLGTRIATLFRDIGLRPDETIKELRGGTIQNPFEE